MFRGRGRGSTTVVVVKETTPAPAPTVAVVHSAPPTSCAPPSTTAVVERHFVEYAYHDMFEKVWDDRHTGADPFDGSFFHPIAPAGFFAVGSIAVRGQVDHPHGVRALVVREPAPIPGHPHLLAAPTSFTKIWEDKGTGGRYGDCSFWWPNAPAGYVAIGVVVVKGYNQPHPDLVRCIHLSAVVPGHPHPEADGHFVWCDRKSRAKFGDVSVWNLHPGHGGVHTGTFVCTNNYSQPNANFFTVAENPRGAVVIPVPVCAPPATTVAVVHTAPPTSCAPPSTVAYVAPPPATGGHPPPASAVPYAQPHATVVVAQPPPQPHATVVVAQPAHHHHHAPPSHGATVVVAQPAHHHHHAPPSHGATVVVAQPAHHHHAPPPAHGHGATVVVAQPAHHHGPTVVVAQPARGGLFGRR